MGNAAARDAHTPEDLAATIHHAVGLPESVAWHDEPDRLHCVYHNKPIRGQMG